MQSDRNRGHQNYSFPSSSNSNYAYTHQQNQYLSPFANSTTPTSHTLNDQLPNPWDAGPAPPVPPRPRVHSMVHIPPSYQDQDATPTALTIPIAFPEPMIYRSVSDNPHPSPPPKIQTKLEVLPSKPPKHQGPPLPKPPPPSPPLPPPKHVKPARPAPPPMKQPSLSAGSPHTLVHRHSSYALGATGLHREASVGSVVSTASSYYHHQDDDYPLEETPVSDRDSAIFDDALNRLSLDADEALKRFQNGELAENDEEWYKLVPEEAREALGKKEVQRQSVIFEVFKAERDYVADLGVIQDIRYSLAGCEPLLLQSLRHLVSKTSLVRMLDALFQRQREQHPLVQSVADIILDTVLREKFRSSYEEYIKHYPLSESHHRKELKHNSKYREFIQSVSDDPRIRKRDIITFLSRPVTRLPRLNLVLEHILKLTDKEFDHPDLESLPTILSILNVFLKSTQPGIAAAESKVKLWELCEFLEFQKGEIIDMELTSDSRALVYSGPVVRRVRSDTGFSSWMDLTATLIDNYFILTRDSKRSNGTVKKVLTSRPIPLSYLRYAAFDAAPETRRERSEEGGILDSLRYQTVEIFPFTVYHASNALGRRYTLFVTSDAVRKKWRSALEDAIVVHKVRQEANMWYDPRVVTDGFFRTVGSRTASQDVTGRATCAVPFISGGRHFIAVGCPSGIYVSTWASEEFKKVLKIPSPIQLAAIQSLGDKTFNRLLVHHEYLVSSYSLDILARVALEQAQMKTLDASMERVAGHDSNVLFFRVAEIKQRVLLIYATKKRLQLSPTLNVLEAMSAADLALTTTQRTQKPGIVHVAKKLALWLNPCKPGYVPKDAFDISPLTRTIGICTRDGIVIADPTNLVESVISLVPDFQKAGSDLIVSLLKGRVEDAKPLGLIRLSADELMVVYDTLGCFITKRGELARSARHVKWETQAHTFARQNNHVILFSPQFIEIRDIETGRLVQVIEGVDIRLLYFNPIAGNKDPVIVAMKGKKDDREGVSDRIIELVETVELPVSSPVSAASTVRSLPSAMWDEWDM
ncbi:hypothetical protein AMATHDRAFT_45896 [Amanita thiersii Skay4041]|uniref:DH domain-containing protein n=1 Tax=Amanita thiersii Skay4041 TaxID=703135 RepID=A0A2A9NYM4_9AGAR|nr:hypothetical protein AMATHDRAFT_45896 [Amanita thiersii Skay4041]